MISSGRIASIAIVALGLGFVGGAWFIGSGFGFQLIPVPVVAPSLALPPSPPVTASSLKISLSMNEAVAVPRSLVVSGGSGGLRPRVARTDLLPTPGCAWEVEPHPFDRDGFWHKTNPERALGGYPAIDPWTRGVRYLLIQSTGKGGTAIDLRPVFFDEDAKRLVTRPGSRSSSQGPGGEFFMTEFHLDFASLLTIPRVAYFGIERVVPDSARQLVESAQAEATAKGIAILPAPRLGEPYRFDLPTADGRRVRSEDFQGKAILVAIWGPNGSSFSALGMIKRLRESYTDQDLVIVGVSYHESVEKAREVSDQFGPGGPLVVIPNDPEIRRVWSQGSDVAQLPTLLLVDREGVLQFDCNPFDLQNRVDILFERADPPFSMMIRRPWPKPKAPAPSKVPAPSGAPRPGPR